MEDEFLKLKKDRVLTARNIVTIETMIYVTVFLTTFGYGGRLEELYTTIVPLISIDGLIKMSTIVFFLILAGVAIMPGSLILTGDISTYIERRKSKSCLLVD